MSSWRDWSTTRSERLTRVPSEHSFCFSPGTKYPGSCNSLETGSRVDMDLISEKIMDGCRGSDVRAALFLRGLIWQFLGRRYGHLHAIIGATVEHLFWRLEVV